MTADGQRFCLKWNDFRNSVTAVFEDLRQDEELVDITLCCEGKKVKAHRMMLSACSPYFRELLKENPCQHPVFFLKDTTYVDLKAVIEFVYNGEVNVTQGQLSSFLKTAEMLQVRGLTGDDEKESPAPPPPPPPPVVRHPPAPALAHHAPPKRPSVPSMPPRVLPPTPLKRPMLAPQPAPTPPKRPAPPPDSDVYVEPVVVSDSPPEVPPASPAAGRVRHRSGSSGGPPTPAGSEPSADAAPSPADPTAPPPPPPPPPAPALAPAAPQHLSESLPPPPPPLPVGPDGRDPAVKVEKIDIADDDVSLEAALGQVVNYEGAYDSEQHSMTGLLQQGELSQGGVAPLPGTSDAGGAASGGKYRKHCPICMKTFGSPSSLYEHRLTHEGLTNCPVCGKFLSRLSNLRRHMETLHQIPKDQLDVVLGFSLRR